MISVQNLSVSFGGSSLFEDVSFLINKKDRIGLTGKNGAGKSTMLKILSGKQELDKGKIAGPKTLSTGYLAQEISNNSTQTVIEEAIKAFDEINDLEKRNVELAELLEKRTDYESDEYHSFIDELHEINERLHILGTSNKTAEAEKVLKGLGFERSDFEKPCNVFSGGWKMRIELAKILLRSPDLMLLDEPTNHLDIESIQWLENFLRNYSGAVILVSHDRMFLDKVTNRTIEISLGKIQDYKANYSTYEKLRKERSEQLLAAKKNQDKEIEHTKELIDKFRAKKNKAAFAQSLIKKLDKIERVELDEMDNSGMKFRFPPASRSGKVVVKAEHLSKKYDSKTIFSNINIEVERGDKIALVGKNGEGKSTFIRLLAGEKNYEGEILIGHNVNIGYFAQNQAEELDENKTVFETIDDIAAGEMRKNVRNLLGSFLFSGDAIDKKVKVLSGGEKNRLALCKLILEPYNLLLLDEPTNHLDMLSKDVLKEALLAYDGTIIIVSHDRDFLTDLTDKLYLFKAGNVKPFLGGISEFLEYQKLESLKELEKSTKISEPVKSDAEGKTAFSKKKNDDKEIRKLKNEFEKTEKNIIKIEKEIEQINLQLSSQINDTELIQELTGKFGQLNDRLEAEMLRWQELATELEK